MILEAMRWEHEVRAPGAGEVLAVHAARGATVAKDAVLVELGDAPARHGDDDDGTAAPGTAASSDATTATGLRADLREARDRHALTLDEARPDAIARRHARGLRSARENVADLVDPGSFSEYGALAYAAQTSRRTVDDLTANTPADGLITGIGAVNGALFDAGAARCAVMAYDATVLAGTQGMRNHEKTDRLVAIALQQNLPLALFAEGGGGRPGDTDSLTVAGLHLTSSPRSHASAGRCRSSASSPAAVSPATPRSSAAAT